METNPLTAQPPDDGGAVTEAERLETLGDDREPNYSRFYKSAPMKQPWHDIATCRCSGCRDLARRPAPEKGERT